MSSKDKNERTYWNVKESAIDKELLVKIKKSSQITFTISTILLTINALFFMFQIGQKYFIETFMIVCSILVILIAISAIVILIVNAVNLGKLKKQVLKIQEVNKTNQTDSNIAN